MKSTRGTAGRIFSALAHAHINVKMIDQGSSELNIIVGVRHDDFIKRDPGSLRNLCCNTDLTEPDSRLPGMGQAVRQMFAICLTERKPEIHNRRKAADSFI